MGRTADIFSRAVRNIKKYDPTFRSTNKTLIYDDMQAAQDDIYQRVQLEGSLIITLVANQETYNLVDSNSRKVIGSIKDLVRPNGASQTSGTLTVGVRYTISNYESGDDFTNVGAASNADDVSFVATGTTPTTWTNGSTLAISDWEYKVSIVPNSVWDDIKSATYNVTQPVKATVIGNQIKLFPIPTSSYEGDQITALCYLNGSPNTIDASTEPDVPDIFDKAIEYFATAQNLKGEQEVYYMGLYEKEIEDKGVLVQKKHHSLQVMQNW